MSLDIVYDIPDQKVTSSRHTLAVLVDNEFGVLARVIGLFAGRGYNIESLTVAEVEHYDNLSRITIVTSGSEQVIKQIKHLLERLIPVHKVNDLTVEGEHTERELAIVKIKPAEAALEIAKNANVRLLQQNQEYIMFEITDTSGNIDAFIGQMRQFTIIEMARSGVVAI